MSKNFSLIKSYGCSVIGHRYRTCQVVNDRVKEKCCTFCNKKVTTNIYGQTVPLNPVYSQINRALKEVARKRRRASIEVYS